VAEVPIVISFDYQTFDDYWTSYATGPSRAAQRLQEMPAERRDEIRRLVSFGYLAGMPDGPRSFAAIVRSVRGVVPHPLHSSKGSNSNDALCGSTHMDR
jgi:hypothetical protein